MEFDLLNLLWPGKDGHREVMRRMRKSHDISKKKRLIRSLATM